MAASNGIRSWGQKEPLARRIKSILWEGYSDGFSVPKELIQNADDAGATEVCFLYDERENFDARRNLIDQKLAECQGPALWVYNNAEFTEQDFNNITEINGMTKITDKSKIGKFGLGFCSVYNLTDVPSILSGNDLVILDPHNKYIPKYADAGIRLHLSDKRLKDYEGQWKPFQGLFGCEISTTRPPSFNGTLFRLPLRTKNQALTSEISEVHYSRAEVKRLLEMFAKCAGNILLFTQRVQKISIYHKHSSMPGQGVHVISWQRNYVDSVLQYLTKGKTQPFQAIQKITISTQVSSPVSDLICNVQGIRSGRSDSDWLVSWATGTEASVKGALSTHEGYPLSTHQGYPLGSVAVMYDRNANLPLCLSSCSTGFYKVGHFFCFLPLPRETKLNIHINGCFALNAARTDLKARNEDAKYTLESDWNEAILEDSVVNAFLFLLEWIRDRHPDGNVTRYIYHELWPTSCDERLTKFEDSFYGKLVQQNKVLFRSRTTWTSLQQSLFIDQDLINMIEPSIGRVGVVNIIESLCAKGKNVVYLPVSCMKPLRRNCSFNLRQQTVSIRTFFVDLFLPQVYERMWQDCACLRDKLLLIAIHSGDEWIHRKLINTNCIPTLPHGMMKFPHELVHPKAALIGPMFSIEDGRFPAESFKEETSLRKLVKLGMMNETIPTKVVVERARSIQSLNNQRHMLERCRALLLYLSVNSPSIELVANLKTCHFLPVLERPRSWLFEWKSGSGSGQTPLKLQNPPTLFFQNCMDLVGCTKLLLDTFGLEGHEQHKLIPLLETLGVKGNRDVQIETVVEQLLCISNQALAIEHVNESVKEICSKIYRFFETVCCLQLNSKDEEKMKILQTSSVLLMSNGTFVKPKRVALKLRHDCSPFLYGINDSDMKYYPNLLKVLGVREGFHIDVIIDVIEEQKYEHERRVHERRQDMKEMVDISCNLLMCLQDAMEVSGTEYRDLESKKRDKIFAPDTHGILRRTSDLCYEDGFATQATQTVFLVHPRLPRTVAQKVGVLTQRKKTLLGTEICFEQHEDLVTRIHGLLDGYPFDSGIMKELIQNSDDSEATEVQFIFDFCTYPSDAVFDESYVHFQGPAVCVFNDRSFTEEDLIGIQNLGLGSKRDDPVKTGQYGVGFNTVYNLTDVPSFLTWGPDVDGHETFCMFDPLRLCKFLHGRRGTRYMDTTIIRRDYPDVFTPYHKDFFCKHSQGTIFRFPLRRTPSDICNHLGNTRKINLMIAEFLTEMPEMLLFLKNVTKLTVSEITSNGIESKHCVEMTLPRSARNSRDAFFEQCRDLAECSKANKSKILSQRVFEKTFTVDLSNSSGPTESWFIVHRLGFGSARIPDLVQCACSNGKLGLLPHGSVAMKMPTITRSPKDTDPKLSSFRHGHRAYCCLPLPGTTRLPAHINGHFVLDHEARRSLWQESSGYKSEWNKLLLRSVVAPAYVTALKAFQHDLFQDSVKPSELFSLVGLFQSYFPVVRGVTDQYWETLVKEIYSLLVQQKYAVFPRIKYRLDSANKRQNPVLTWHYFNVDNPLFVDTSSNKDQDVAALLKELGMEVVFMNADIFTSMAESGYKFQILTPDAVVTFLKALPLHGLYGPVEETNYRTIANVKLLLEYCRQSDSFINELEGLPLLATNDSLVHVFRRSNQNDQVFCSKYCGLFPSYGHLFVHYELAHLLDIKALQPKLLKPFHVTDILPEMLPQTRSENHCISWDPNSKDIPNKYWISKFWNFVIEDLSQAKPARSGSSTEIILPTNLSNAHLIPALETINGTFGTEKNRVLVEVGYEHIVFDKNVQEREPRLMQTFENLHLLEIDSDCLTGSSIKRISRLCATFKSPLSVIKCLLHHKNKLQSGNISEEDCENILAYFSESVIELDRCKPSILAKLRELPLFWGLNGKMSLADKDPVLVLSNNIPEEGLSHLTSSSLTVLKENYRLYPLLEFLGIQPASCVRAYNDWILNCWENLPDWTLPIHLNFLKREVERLERNGQIEDTQTLNLISRLRQVPVIAVQGDRKRISDFFDPFNPVFAAVHPRCDFPPENYHFYDWIHFFQLIGLKSTVTNEMFISYAEDIINQVDQRKISKCLVECLMRGETNFNYQQISNIPFIVQHGNNRVHEMLAVGVEKDRAELIPFKLSQTLDKENLCWTCGDILPDWADPRSYVKHELCDKLGIHTIPPLDCVLKHFRNISSSVDTVGCAYIQEHGLGPFLEQVFEDIYKYLLSHELQDIDFSRHKTIFLPEDLIIVQGNNIVLEIHRNEEIHPYLFKAPLRYGQFFELFEALGALKEPSASVFLGVLSRLKENKQNMAVDDLELGIAIKAAQLFLSYFKKSEGNSEKIQTFEVFNLPNAENIMVDVKTLVIIDDTKLKSRFERGTPASSRLGVGMAPFETLRNVQLMKVLPASIRPLFLTECVVEKLDDTILCDCSESPFQNFLRSSQCINSIFSIVRAKIFGMSMPDDEAEQISKHFSRDSERNFIDCLRKIEVMQTFVLRTVLVFKAENERIPNSEEDKRCFLDSSSDVDANLVLYHIDVDEDDLVDVVEDTIIALINKLTNNVLREDGHVISGILQRWKIPNTLPNYLEIKEIQEVASELMPARTALSPDPVEAKRWQKQARVDFNSAVSDLAGTRLPYNWICYKFHQAAEKSLKSACYARDSFGVPRSHSLGELSDQHGETIMSLSRDLGSILGRDTSMKYPDATPRPSIPSDLYSKDQALRARDLTSKLLDAIETVYFCDTC